MQRESRQRRKSMREIAEAILLNEDLRKSRLNEPEKWPVRNSTSAPEKNAATINNE
jgi:uroporphyrinogen-III synthase